MPRPTAISRRTALGRLGATMLAAGVPLTRYAPSLDAAPPRAEDDFALLLRRATVPSFALAQVEGDRVTTRFAGVRRTGDPEPVGADTVYPAASLTKTVFAYMFLDLVADGVVELDRPVREYLPLPNPEDPRAGAITARRLLSHSGGWRNWRNNASQPLTADFDPGSRWGYSGEGFFFMARIAEKLTGRSFGQLARERVFAPLGMKRTSMALLPELEPYLAAPHSGRGDPVQPFGRPAQLELRKALAARGEPVDNAKTEDAEQALRTADPSAPVLPNNLNPNAAASMLTTANDFGAFLRHLVTAKRRGGRAATIVDMMMTPQVRCNDAVQWGLGVGLEDIGTRRLAWQWGDNQGYKHIYFADPREEKAIVVFTNGDRGPRVYERIIRALTGEDHPAFLWA